MKVFIYTPSNGGMVHAPYAMSFAATMCDLALNGIEPQFVMDSMCCSLPKSRNGAVAYVLNNPDIDWLIFIDADMSWEPVWALRTMLTSGHKIVLGGYVSRGKKPFWTMRRIPRIRPDDQGFMPIVTGPSGFLCIHRSVLENIAAQRPDLKINLNHDLPAPPGEYLLFREARSESGLSLTSDDYGFFETVRALGIPIICYTKITFGHHWTTANYCNVFDQIAAEDKPTP